MAKVSKPTLNLELIHQITALLDSYLRESQDGKHKAVDAKPIQEVLQQLELQELSLDQPLPSEEILKFIQKYLNYTVRVHHPHFLAHQTGVPNQGSLIGDLVNSITANGMGVYEMGPSAVTVENFIVDWLNQKVGFHNGGGVLTHGGSLGNLTALLTARAVMDPQAWQNGNDPNSIFFFPETSHYSIHRTAAIMGYGEKSIWKIPCHDNGTVDVSQLSVLIQNAKQEGKRIIAVTCNACATATGLYDPIFEMAQICREHGIWFHVDGAHGASALLSQKYKNYLKGIELADSVVWDLHKMLQSSGLCTGVLLREKTHVRRAFQQKASYLKHGETPLRDDLYEKSVECTKIPIGFKFLMNLFTMGEKGLGDYVDFTYDLTRQIYQLIQSTPKFSSPIEPDSNILLFQYKSGNVLQAKIYDQLILDGNFYTTKATLNDQTYLRLVVMNQSITLSVIQDLLSQIEKIAES